MSDLAGKTNDREPPLLRLTITPEPTGDEGEALIAAIVVYLSANAPVDMTIEEPPAPSRWAAAGKRSAVRGVNVNSQLGWGRRRAGWS